MNILITAIGSMSAAYVITSLKKAGHTVVGCDIYPEQWHSESALCDAFHQAPLTCGDDYIPFLIKVCRMHRISHLIPLTDLEIDKINLFRPVFTQEGITLCMPSEQVLKTVRNKYQLYRFFKDDELVPSIPTRLAAFEDPMSYPCIAKPCDGRSSEGLMTLESPEQLAFIRDRSRYIFQEKKEGNIHTVDYIRCAETGKDFCIAREELLRTSNGAGLTVRLFQDETLSFLVSHVGKALGINGCVNMEFILDDGKWWLIDFNPRFSAGTAFSGTCGYDLALNHLHCFCGRDIDAGQEVEEMIVTKRYQEEILWKRKR